MPRHVKHYLIHAFRSLDFLYWRTYRVHFCNPPNVSFFGFGFNNGFVDWSFLQAAHFRRLWAIMMSLWACLIVYNRLTGSERHVKCIILQHFPSICWHTCRLCEAVGSLALGRTFCFHTHQQCSTLGNFTSASLVQQYISLVSASIARFAETCGRPTLA